MTAPDTTLDHLHMLIRAASLTRKQVDLMAHAVGWPSLSACEEGARHGRPRWRRPYRNYFAASPKRSGDWDALAAGGFARLIGEPADAIPYRTYSVSPFGLAVLRIRLRAAIESHEQRKLAKRGQR